MIEIFYISVPKPEGFAYFLLRLGKVDPEGVCEKGGLCAIIPEMFLTLILTLSSREREIESGE